MKKKHISWSGYFKQRVLLLALNYTYSIKLLSCASFEFVENQSLYVFNDLAEDEKVMTSTSRATPSHISADEDKPQLV